MSASLIRSVVAVATVCAAGLAMAACTPTEEPGGDVETPEVGAAWLDDGRMIGVVTAGSSSCVPTAGEPIFADGVVTVGLRDPDAEACTEDFVPRGTPVPLPAGVDPADDLDVVVTGDYVGEVTLLGDRSLDPGETGLTEFEPTAGWYGEGQFLILTWGSSTCLPVVSSTEATADGEIVVTLVEPRADQICTLDIVPQVTATSVEGVTADTAELVLNGDGYDAVSIPIVGSH